MSPSGNLLVQVLFQVLYSVSLYVIDIIIPSVIQGLLLNVRFVKFGFSSFQNISIVSLNVLLNLTKSKLLGEELIPNEKLVFCCMLFMKLSMFSLE